MLKLILGIVLFHGMHSMSAIALPLRNRLVARNEKAWKAVYSLASLIGLVLIVFGYGEARLEPKVLYVSPIWLHPVAQVLLIPAFILFFAPYFPGGIKSRVGHPQLLSIMLWAAAHLLVNGMLADILLFGAFLLWAAAVRISFIWRPARPVAGAPPSKANDVILIALGLAFYAVFAFWLHRAWFGVDALIGLR